MSKIEEMAEEYAYANWQDDSYHEGAAEGLPFDAIGHTMKSFEEGANAVLREIEGVLPHLAKKGVIYSILKDKIQELKGE